MNIREKNIMEQTNFLIEGMTIMDLEETFLEKTKTNKNLRDIYERNQYKFITKFFSDFLQKDGKYIKGTHLKDLINLYYIDYYIKEKLSRMALKVEKYLNISILNSHEDNKISKRTGDKQNAFGEVVNFFKNKLNEKEKLYIIKLMNKQYKSTFKGIDEFQEHIFNIVGLRNFCLHHYSVVSYKYASKIKNGDEHIDKRGKEKTLEQAVKSLCHFLNFNSSQQLMKQTTKIVKKHSFSNPQIQEHVLDQLKTVMNFESLEKVTKQNTHFSVTDLINDNYSHASDVE